VFSLGFLLSVFDIFSTYLLVAKDRTHRPGVSVTLKGRLVRAAQIRVHFPFSSPLFSLFSPSFPSLFPLFFSSFPPL